MYTELRIKSTYIVILGQSAFEMPSRRNNNADVTCSTYISNALSCVI